MTSPGSRVDVKSRLAIALDTSDLNAAVSIAKAVQENIGIRRSAYSSLVLQDVMQFVPCRRLAWTYFLM